MKITNCIYATRKISKQNRLYERCIQLDGAVIDLAHAGKA